MEYLIDQITWLQNKGTTRGFVFGLVHTIIPLIGFYSGWSINRTLKIISNGYVAGIFGVVFAHVIADYIAATLDPDLKNAAIGIVLGGLVPLLLVPFMEKYIIGTLQQIVMIAYLFVRKDGKSPPKMITHN